MAILSAISTELAISQIQRLVRKAFRGSAPVNMTAVENNIPNGRPLHDSSASESSLTSTKQMDADSQQVNNM